MRICVLTSIAVVFILLSSTLLPVAGAISGWQEPTLIEEENLGGADYLDLAVSANGDAVAVWRQNNGTVSNICANRYEHGTGWTGAVLIVDRMYTAQEPRVVIDPDGNTVVIWLELNSSTWIYDVWANKYDIGSGWGEAIRIEENNSGGASAPAMAMDNNENAMAVWAQYDDSWINIRAIR